jgi:Zn-dependent peptidase ImmA (M78 family)
MPVISLVFGVQVYCHSNQAEWQAHLKQENVPATATAYYYPVRKDIILGPLACNNIGTQFGAWVMAHELAHVWQEEQGRTFDEPEADRIANRTWSKVRARICKARACVGQMVRIAP